jgi:hypothetical protein
MTNEILGHTEDGDEVPSLGEGWIVLDGSAMPVEDGHEDDLEVIAEVLSMADTLEEAEGGEAFWKQAIKTVPYFNGLNYDFPPLYKRDNFDALPGFMVQTTVLEEGPGQTFPDHWIHLDVDSVDQVLTAFEAMAGLLREFLGAQDLA